MAKGVSLRLEDAVVGGGLFGPGRAKLKKARFGIQKYTDKAGKSVRKGATALLCTYLRKSEDGEVEKHVEGYTTGDGFSPSDDGLTLVPKSGQNGLVNTTKCMQFLTSLVDHGMKRERLADLSTDISGLDGITVDLIRKPLPKIEGSTAKNPPTVLLVDEILAAPQWPEIKAGGKKKKDEDEDEDTDSDEEEEEEDESEDEDEEETPKKKGKKKSTKSGDDDEDEDEAEDEDDEDEAPKKKKKKKKPADDDEDEEDEEESDDEDESEDEDTDEAATEALIEALEDGPLKLAKVRDAVLAQAKKLKNKKAIAARAADPKFLKKEAGWSFDGKTVTVD